MIMQDGHSAPCRQALTSNIAIFLDSEVQDQFILLVYCSQHLKTSRTTFLFKLKLGPLFCQGLNKDTMKRNI